jgi:hypothetical protein
MWNSFSSVERLSFKTETEFTCIRSGTVYAVTFRLLLFEPKKIVFVSSYKPSALARYVMVVIRLANTTSNRFRDTVAWNRTPSAPGDRNKILLSYKYYYYQINYHNRILLCITIIRER